MIGGAALERFGIRWLEFIFTLTLPSPSGEREIYTCPLPLQMLTLFSLSQQESVGVRENHPAYLPHFPR